MEGAAAFVVGVPAILHKLVKFDFELFEFFRESVEQFFCDFRHLGGRDATLGEYEQLFEAPVQNLLACSQGFCEDVLENCTKNMQFNHLSNRSGIISTQNRFYDKNEYLELVRYFVHFFVSQKYVI